MQTSKGSLVITLTLFLLPFLTHAQPPAGHIAHYLLNNAATDDGPNAYDGYIDNTTAGPDRFGYAGRATVFTPNDSYGELPFELADAMKYSFTLNFWLKSNLVAPSGINWYEGLSLLDAESCGNVGDWGLGIVNGGKIVFGKGPSDLSVSSVNDYNDNNWHFVTAVRNQGASTFSLYVDGVFQESSVDPDPIDLDGVNSIGLGMNTCSFNPAFGGSMDEIIVYDRVLTALEITSLYTFSSLFTLPLDFIAFSGRLSDNTARLSWEVANVVNNHHFEVEYSTDGRSFTNAGTVANRALVSVYNYLISGLNNGKYFFRIRQVDIDGKSSYSKTITVELNGQPMQLSISGNPVSGQLVLRNPSLVAINQYVITDASGRQIQVKQGTTTGTEILIDVSTLKAGYYLLLLTTGDGRQTLPFIRK